MTFLSFIVFYILVFFGAILLLGALLAFFDSDFSGPFIFIFLFLAVPFSVYCDLPFEAIKLDGDIVKSYSCYELDEHKYCEGCFGKEFVVIDYWNLEE